MKELEERAYKAMQELVDVANSMNGDKAVAAGMYNGLLHSHRTLQQSFMRNFVEVMKEYSKANTDLRNEKAVEFAKKVTELEFYFPMV